MSRRRAGPASLAASAHLVRAFGPGWRPPRWSRPRCRPRPAEPRLLSGAGRAVLGTVAEGRDAHPVHPERDRDGPATTSRSSSDVGAPWSREASLVSAAYGSARSPCITRSTSRCSRARSGSTARAAAAATTPAPKGGELGTHGREQADHHGVPGRDEDDQPRRRRSGDTTSATPSSRRRSTAETSTTARKAAGSNVEESATGAQTARPATTATTKTPSARSRDITRVRPPIGAQQPDHHRQQGPGAAAPAVATPQAEQGAAQSSSSTPTAFGRSRTRPASRSRGGSRSTHEHPASTRRPAPRSGTPPAAAIRREEADRRAAAAAPARCTARAARRTVDVPDRPAVTRAGETRPHLGQRGSSEDRGHRQHRATRPSFRARGRQRASPRALPTAPAAGRPSRLISPSASSTDRQRQ